jgi:hypothetical protein
VRNAILKAGRLLGVAVWTSCVLGLALPAIAQDVDCATIGWAAAAGPVVSYDVYVEINSEAPLQYGSSDEPELEISGPMFEEGDALRFQVVAVAADGRRSPASELSDVIFCGSVPVPQALSVVDGSALKPNRLSWQSVQHAEFYVIMRSTDPGDPGSVLGLSEASMYEDATADLDVVHYYSVVAVAGRQISDFSDPVQAIRSGTSPQLAVSTTQLFYSAQLGETTAQQSFELRNVGGGSLDYQAWVFAPWLELSSTAGVLEDGAESLTLTYDLDSLAAGSHSGVIVIYGYYDQQVELDAPLEIRVTVDIPAEATQNRPPVIAPPFFVGVSEGGTVVLPIRATDPDAGDQVEIGVSGMPSWVSFQSDGGGEGTLTFTPDFDSAGSYTGLLWATDDGLPGASASQEFTIVVRDQNRSPVIASVTNRTLAVGQTEAVPIAAFDPDLGDRLAFPPASLPRFATLVDFGNGSGEIVFEPATGDAGSYLIVFGVVDDGSPPIFAGTSFVITVEE